MSGTPPYLVMGRVYGSWVNITFRHQMFTLSFRAASAAAEKKGKVRWQACHSVHLPTEAKEKTCKRLAQRKSPKITTGDDKKGQGLKPISPKGQDRRMYIYIYVCVNAYIHTCIHTYIHTYITLHYITLHYITLRYITLQYMTLHTLHTVHTLHTLHTLRTLRTLNRLVGWLVRGQRMSARPGPRFPPGRSLGFKPAGN